MRIHGHMEELVEKAKVAIGEDAIDDYKILPTDFPEKFGNNAPEISAVLRHSSFKEKASRYEENDELAVTSQAKFKKFAHQATWSICSAAVAGSLLAGLAVANFNPNCTKFFIFILGLISAIGGGLAVYRLHQIRSEKLLERWMAARAKAETERLGYFSSLARHLIENYRSEIYLHLLFISIFKRYQLEVQRLYYTSRSGDHRNSLEITSTIGAVAALCLALGSGMLGMVGAFQPDFLPLAALGTLGAAVSALASRREELNQDGRNSERYSRTAEILSKIAEKHDDIIAIVNGGDNPEIIIEYVETVNDQLSLEHRQWTSDASEMSSALGALEKSISEFNKE